MFTTPLGSNQRFRFHEEDHALLIQFVVAEFIRTYRLMSDIQQITEKTFTLFQSHMSFFPLLIQHFDQLLGCLLPYSRFAPTSWTKGPLTKLREYSEYFTQQPNIQNKYQIDFQLTVHQTWLIAINNLEILHTLQLTDNQSSKQKSLIKNLKKSLKDLNSKLDQTTRQLSKMMQSFCNNENVILFLLRHCDSLVEIFGEGFLNKCFKSKLKSEEIFHLLETRYKARGFEHLLGTIQEALKKQEIV